MDMWLYLLLIPLGGGLGGSGLVLRVADTTRSQERPMTACPGSPLIRVLAASCSARANR